MVQMLGFLPQVRAPELPDVGNALNKLGESVRYYRSEADKAQAYADAQEQKRYSRGRAAASDGKAEVEAFGKRALQVAQMPDDDPMKPKMWGYILDSHNKRNPGAQLSAEEMDWKTGPKLMAAQAGQFLDPYEQEERSLKLQKLRREASGQGAPAEMPMNVREWEYFNKLPPDQQSQYLNMKRSIPYLDQGTQFAKPDPVTGQPMATLPIDNAGQERAKVVGRETGEGQMQLPKAANALQTYEVQDDAVNTAIDQAIKMADGFGATGLPGQVSSGIGGTPAFNLAKQLDTVKGNIGFDKLQSLRDNSPTGGALGQVAVQELVMLQSVLGSLDQAQDAEQLKAQLAQVKTLRAQFRKMKQEAYQRDVQRFGAANVPNPETGQIGASQGVGASGGGVAADPLGIR